MAPFDTPPTPMIVKNAGSIDAHATGPAARRTTR